MSLNQHFPNFSTLLKLRESNGKLQYKGSDIEYNSGEYISVDGTYPIGQMKTYQEWLIDKTGYWRVTFLVAPILPELIELLSISADISFTSYTSSSIASYQNLISLPSINDIESVLQSLGQTSELISINATNELVGVSVSLGQSSNLIAIPSVLDFTGNLSVSLDTTIQGLVDLLSLSANIELNPVLNILNQVAELNTLSANNEVLGKLSSLLASSTLTTILPNIEFLPNTSALLDQIAASNTVPTATLTAILYTMLAPSTPTVTGAPSKVTVTSPALPVGAKGINLYYTIDGSDPTLLSTKLSNVGASTDITASAGTTVKVIATGFNGTTESPISGIGSGVATDAPLELTDFESGMNGWVFSAEEGWTTATGTRVNNNGDEGSAWSYKITTGQGDDGDGGVVGYPCNLIKDITLSSVGSFTVRWKTANPTHMDILVNGTPVSSINLYNTSIYQSLSASIPSGTNQIKILFPGSSDFIATVYIDNLSASNKDITDFEVGMNGWTNITITDPNLTANGSVLRALSQKDTGQYSCQITYATGNNGSVYYIPYGITKTRVCNDGNISIRKMNTSNINLLVYIDDVLVSTIAPGPNNEWTTHEIPITSGNHKIDILNGANILSPIYIDNIILP